jgi:nucleotide-binding universal stress UspA family protein
VHVREPGAPGEPDPDPAVFQRETLSRLPRTVADRAKVEVHRAVGIPAILRSARDLALDLVVVGRRLPSEQIGIGSAFTRLARKCPCTVLVVPNYARVHLNRILVPVDFSQHSKLALEQALGIARASGSARPEVVVQSVFSVHYGYRKTSGSLHEAVREREQLTRARLDEFVRGVDKRGIELETVCMCSEQVETAIHELAAVRKMDMIVIGSRGSGWTAAVLLGATAERILVTSALPVLIVKEKGETTHLLNTLLGEG